MKTNNSLTIYHKTFDKTTRLEKWTRYNYPNVWFFGNESATISEGYNSKNRVEIRIPLNESIKKDNFAKGDIIVKGTLETDINTQQDLSGLIYNITSISWNDFGEEPHIHIGGR